MWPLMNNICSRNEQTHAVQRGKKYLGCYWVVLKLRYIYVLTVNILKIYLDVFKQQQITKQQQISFPQDVFHS